MGANLSTISLQAFPPMLNLRDTIVVQFSILVQNSVNILEDISPSASITYSSSQQAQTASRRIYNVGGLGAMLHIDDMSSSLGISQSGPYVRPSTTSITLGEITPISLDVRVPNSVVPNANFSMGILNPGKAAFNSFILNVDGIVTFNATAAQVACTVFNTTSTSTYNASLSTSALGQLQYGIVNTSTYQLLSINNAVMFAPPCHRVDLTLRSLQSQNTNPASLGFSTMSFQLGIVVAGPSIISRGGGSIS